MADIHPAFCSFITAIQILFLIIIIIHGFLKWIKKDYDLIPVKKIAETMPAYCPSCSLDTCLKHIRHTGVI